MSENAPPPFEHESNLLNKSTQHFFTFFFSAFRRKVSSTSSDVSLLRTRLFKKGRKCKQIFLKINPQGLVPAVLKISTIFIKVYGQNKYEIRISLH